MGLLNILANNSKGVDAKAAESKMRSEFPALLGPNEHIQLAFKASLDTRDKNYLTTHRILIKDTKGISGKKKKFKSIPYKAIKAFAVQTAGGFDSNTELLVWYDGGSMVKTISFAKDSVDLFEVQQFFNHKVFSTPQGGLTSTTTKMQDYSTDAGYVKQATNVESVLNWIGSDAVQVDPQAIQNRFGFGASSPILMPGEQVEIAYQCRRDVIILTPTRFLLIDVKGLSGKKVEFFSIRWKCIKAFSVETAGRFDRDGDFIVHTSIPGCQAIRHDLRKGKTDMFQLNTAFSNKLLGGGSPSDKVAGVNQYKGHVDMGGGLFGGDNARPLDREVVERTFRSNPCILQSDEYVEMAFKGRRDLVIFTTKRIIDVDVKGWSGKKVKYTSIPYSSVLAFEVNTAGKHDRDSEVIVYTEIMYNAPPEAEEPDPGMSVLEWDFNKNAVDVLSLKRYLNSRLLGAERGVRVPTGLLAAAPKEHGMSKIWSTLGEDQRQIDANELDTYLRTSLDLLLDDENVVMAFKAGRDISCFTNKRIFIIDKKGWSGKKIAYQSIPYKSVKAFSAESAGGWDRDSTVGIHTKNYWNLSYVHLDFRKGKADIIAIQNFLSAIILGSERDAANYLKTVNSGTIKQAHPKGMNGFTDFIIDVSVEVDPKVTDAQLHSDPPILLDDEHVEKVYREGRDLWVYTNLRILRADVKGISGSKVNYITIPFNQNSVTAFAVQTAGSIDIDSECFVYTSIPSMRQLMQRVLVKNGNIFDMHKYLSNRMLFDTSMPEPAPARSSAPSAPSGYASSRAPSATPSSTYTTQSTYASSSVSPTAPPSMYDSSSNLASSYITSTAAPVSASGAVPSSYGTTTASSYVTSTAAPVTASAAVPSSYGTSTASSYVTTTAVPSSYGSSNTYSAAAPSSYASATTASTAVPSNYGTSTASSYVTSTASPITTSAAAPSGYGTSTAYSTAPSSSYAPATTTSTSAAYVTSTKQPSNLKPYV